MKLLRDPETRREFLACAVLTAVFTAAGFFLRPLCGVLMLLAGTASLCVRLYFAGRRRRRLEALSRDIDRILHGQDAMLISDSEEGETAILQSEVRKMTVRLKEQTDRLSADKLRLTEAIQDIFHQIRTPLTSMNLLAALLAEDGLDDGRRMQLTRELRRQLERTRWLVEALLKLSKIDAGTAGFRRDAVSVRALCEAAADPLRIPAELRGQTLRLDVSDERFTGDLRWTAEALSNLIKNCTEHTPAGGTITVAARETALFTEIAVEDDGPGFAKEDLPHLFERFYRGRGASDGSVGIGLALARSIAAAQNGTLAAYNVPGGGAKFVLRFYKSVI